MTALTQSCTSAGISSSRNACPVGAVSITIRSRRAPAVHAERFGDVDDCGELVDARRRELEEIPHRLLIGRAAPGSDEQFVDTLREAITKSRERPRARRARGPAGSAALPRSAADRRTLVLRARPRPSGPDQPTAAARAGQATKARRRSPRLRRRSSFRPRPCRRRAGAAIPRGTTVAASTACAPAVSAALKRLARGDRRPGLAAGFVKWPTKCAQCSNTSWLLPDRGHRRNGESGPDRLAARARGTPRVRDSSVRRTTCTAFAAAGSSG